jgi:hypothetical protein
MSFEKTQHATRRIFEFGEKLGVGRNGFPDRHRNAAPHIRDTIIVDEAAARDAQVIRVLRV